MGDMGEGWAEHKKQRQEKKASNRESSANRLDEIGIPYVSKNGGAHLIVSIYGVDTKKQQIIDFWPGTGKWIVRSGEKGRGIRSLLEEANKRRGKS